jgi:PAS domain S-box-containing protein
LEKKESGYHRSPEAWRSLLAEYDAIIEDFDGVYICSQNYDVEFANQKTIEKVGYDPVGQKCYQVLYGLENVCPWCQNERVFKGEKVTWEVLSPKDICWYHVINTPIHHPDGTMSNMALLRDITEHKQAKIGVVAEDIEFKKMKQALSLREREYRTLVENLPILIVRYDTDLHRIYVNPAWEKANGLSAADVINKLPSENTRLPKPVIVEYEKKLRQVLENGNPQKLEFSWVDARGEPLFLEYFIVPEYDGDGKIINLLSFGIDQTERKQAEEALRQVNETLRATLDVAPAAIIDLDPEGRVKSLWNPAAEQMLGWRRDEVLGQFMPTVSEESKEEFAGVLELVCSGKPIMGKDVVRRRQDGSRIEYSIYAAPEYDDEGKVSGFIAVLVDITERKLAEQKAAQLAAIVQSSDDAIIGKTLDGIITSWNKGAEKIYGYHESEVVGQSISLLVPPGIKDEVPQILAKIKQGEPVEHYETMRRRKDGQDIYMSLTASPIRDAQGRIVAASTIGRDITERKQAEEQIRNNERNLRTTIDTIPAFVFSALPDGSIDFASRSWFDYTGLSPESVFGWDWTTVVHPEDRDRTVENWRESLATGEPGENEYRFRQANGEYRWILARNAALRDEKGHIVRWYGVLVDIENQKRTEEALRRSEAHLAESQRLAHIGSWVWETGTGKAVHLSDEWYRIFGFDPEEDKDLAWEGKVHRVDPEDRRRWLAAVERAIKEKSGYEVEERISLPDGSIKHLHGIGYPILNASGDVVQFMGTIQDVTERKRAEARLLQALGEIKKLQDQLRKENIALRQEVDTTSMFEEIVGASPPLKTVLARLNKVAPTDSIVFITGETGSGKELVARAIHRRSPRSSRAFVSVNCSAIPTPLIASELFGHEKGAFTGAHQRRLGRFELAEGGTIFLDEIGELPMETQIALLRVLQDQEFERLGGNRPIRANVRVITATNRDLKAAIEAGSFRSDLFYRLNVFPIEVPPLRERREDIPLLVEYFIHRYASKMGKKIRSVSKKTLDLLQSYSWPGNIRELQNVIERSIIVCDTEIFSVEENWLVQESGQAQPVSQPLSDMLVIQAKEMIEAALAESGGRVSGPSGAAAKLGIPPSTLESKIKSLKINKHLFKSA